MIEIDREQLERLARDGVARVAAQSLPILQRHIDGRFDLRHDGGSVLFSSDPRSLIDEYGTPDELSRPWALQGLAEVARGINR